MLDTAPARGAFNMALDEALMDSVRAGAPPVLRFYRWSPACLSLGRNQPAAGHYDAAEIAERGIDVVRRLTGGRAVLHDRELTYSVAMPDRTLGSARAAYTQINAALVAGLRRLGLAVALQPPSAARAPVPSLAPCFRDPAEGEIVAGGRKLVGSAQVRIDGVILQHGSLLLQDDQSAVAGLASNGAAVDADRPATLADHLSPLPSWPRIVAALTAGWSEAISRRVIVSTPTPAETDAARRLEARYSDPSWTWRR